MEKALTIRQALSSYISEALDHAPSVCNSWFHPLQTQKDLNLQPLKKGRSHVELALFAFIASSKSLESIPQSLCSSGLFDFHVQMPAPASSESAAILKHEIQRRCLQCSDGIIQDVASRCEGYDVYDLEILVDRTAHAAIGRFLPYQFASDERDNPTLLGDDFSRAMHDFLPVAMRDITKSATEGGRSGWDDVNWWSC
ncbi:hypothetical protein M0R45_014646 [Rubus argutus]|uniref:Uncharacterized protein n=1 Tax=Rubus argutus TaxID=59490 RepID=A0AAW1XNE9_RUBAR